MADLTHSNALLVQVPTSQALSVLNTLALKVQLCPCFRYLAVSDIVKVGHNAPVLAVEHNRPITKRVEAPSAGVLSYPSLEREVVRGVRTINLRCRRHIAGENRLLPPIVCWIGP
jgi:hypothetical protein